MPVDLDAAAKASIDWFETDFTDLDDECRAVDRAMRFLPHLIDEVRALRSRIAELTEPRPMETAPRDGALVRLIFEAPVCWVNEWGATMNSSIHTFTPAFHGYNPIGWLPIQARPKRPNGQAGQKEDAE